MSTAAPALLAAAAGVGFGHAIMPDHWVPLAVLGRTRRYPLTRVARLSGLAGVAHVLVSMLLGGVLLATGVAFIAFELSGRGHHHDHDHDRSPEGHDHDHSHPDPDSRLHG